MPRIVWDIDVKSTKSADSVTDMNSSLLLGSYSDFSDDPGIVGVSPLFRPSVVLSNVVSDLAIVCTFGIASPYLALLVCVSTCCSVSQWRVVIA